MPESSTSFSVAVDGSIEPLKIQDGMPRDFFFSRGTNDVAPSGFFDDPGWGSPEGEELVGEEEEEGEEVVVEEEGEGEKEGSLGFSSFTGT